MPENVNVNVEEVESIGDPSARAVDLELAGMADEDLLGRATHIADEVRQLGEGRLSDEVVTQIEALGGELDRIDHEMVRRELEQGELLERASAVTSRLDGAEPEPEPEPFEEILEESPAIAAEAEEDEVLVPEVVTDVPIAASMQSTQLANALSNRQSPATKIDGIQLREGRVASLVATPLVPRRVATPDEPMSVRQLAEAICEKRLRFGHIPAGIHDDRLSMGMSTIDWQDQKLTKDPRADYELVQNLSNQWKVLVASGGPCAPFAPRYDIFRLAQPHSPVESALVTVGAERGGIQFIVPPDFRDARAGIGTVTCAEDEAGFGSGSGEATPKPCVHLDCPGTEEACLIAVSHCLEFGNLQFQVFPEWVQARIADLAVEFASVKEVLYLDVFDDVANTTAVTAAHPYGASRGLVTDGRKAAHAYRKRNGMDTDATLDWYLPDFAVPVVLDDLLNDASLGLNYWTSTAADVAAAMRAMNLNVVWYYDTPTGLSQAMTTAQAAGALNEYPTDIVSYMHAPGTFVRLAGGTLDVGLVRDSVLNSTNDLQLFAEEWTQVAKVGIESIKITHSNMCPTGAAPPAAAALLDCTP